MLFARRCVSFAVCLGGSVVSERDCKVVPVACSASRFFSFCRGAVAARDRAFPQHLLHRAGVLGWESKSSSVATRESSEADAARVSLCWGRFCRTSQWILPSWLFSTCFLGIFLFRRKLCVLFRGMLQVFSLSSLAALCCDVPSSPIGPFSRLCFSLAF